MASIPHHAGKSFWLANSGEYQPSLPLQGSTDVDIAIIGGGFTGLSTAYSARKADPSASVAVLESECVGFGASGRTSGWTVPYASIDNESARLLYGQEKLQELQDFAWSGLDHLHEMIDREKMDSDYESCSAIITTLKGHEKGLEKIVNYWSNQPRARDCEVLDRATIGQLLNNDAYSGGCRLPHSGQVNPVKHVRELKRIAMEAGAHVYEQTPVLDLEDDGTRYTLKTPQGELHARHLVLAANGFTHLLPPLLGLQRAQMPIHIYQLITEPLPEKERAAIRWKQVYDKTFYVPFTCRTTVDGRLQFNLCDVYLGRGRSMDEAHRTQFYDAGERLFRSVFPAFKNVPIAQRWSGACSLPFDVRPQIGTLNGGRLSYAFGYGGAGVVNSHNYGRILADLALQRETELTKQWFVAIEGSKGQASQKRFPPLPGLVAALRFTFECMRVAAISRRRRLGLG
ncbi:NAD(P)/FAD-dependent oxidoreductase [Alloalcanivorax xenomutans]|uniref:NAD(P)/FAD-dependent oxidoreductase n=1 Tax=Alloalcanivorax xenomutans TaxID=1094342 RepID=UPI003BA9A737